MMISHYNGCCMLFPAARRLTRHLSSIRKKSCFTREEACRLPPRSLIEPRFNGQSDPYQADGGSPLPARRWHRTSRKENMPGVPSMGYGLKSVTAVKGHAGGGRAPLGERLLKPLETGFTYPALIPLPAWEKACRNTVRVYISLNILAIPLRLLLNPCYIRIFYACARTGPAAILF